MVMHFRSPWSWLVFVLILAPSVFADRQVRYLTPPRLDGAYLGEPVLCHRPMHQICPQMSVWFRGDQLIGDNFGHGGSGWTLGPGTATVVIDRVEAAGLRDKGTPIAIVGAGAIGLFTALELLERGYTDITLIAEKFDGLTSLNAGGLLAPVSMHNVPEMQAQIDEIGVAAYRFYRQIANGSHPTIKQGARVLPTYFTSREDSGLEPYVGQVMKPAVDVTLDFQNGTRRDMVAYDDGIFMDTPGLMATLHELIRGRVKIQQRKVEHFGEISQRVVFNSTGLGSIELRKDDKLTPVQGHLIMLRDQDPTALDYQLLTYLGEGKTAAGFPIKRSFYLFPKRASKAAPNDIGVIGGTFIEGADEANPHTEEFDTLVTNAKAFYGCGTAVAGQ